MDARLVELDQRVDLGARAASAAAVAAAAVAAAAAAAAELAAAAAAGGGRGSSLRPRGSQSCLRLAPQGPGC